MGRAGSERSLLVRWSWPCANLACQSNLEMSPFEQDRNVPFFFSGGHIFVHFQGWLSTNPQAASPFYRLAKLVEAVGNPAPFCFSFGYPFQGWSAFGLLPFARPSALKAC